MTVKLGSKWNKDLLLGLICASLVMATTGCLPKPLIIGADLVDSSDAPPPAIGMKGTGDSGGGNGVNNKVFEAYIVDITETSEWREFLQPINDKLAAILKTESDRLFFTSIAKRMKWYIVPLRLAPLSKKQIGLEVSQDPIEQLALQNEKEIWIDKKFYDDSSSEERARLLTHEIFLAYYRIQFKKFGELCAMYSKDPTANCDGEEQIPEYMRELHDQKFGPQPPRSLNKSDYANIRAMTDWVFRQYADATYESYWAEYKRNGFDKRLIPSAFGGPVNHVSSDSSTDASEAWSGAEILQLLQSSQTLDLMPKYCGTSYATSFTASCSVSVQADPGAIPGSIASVPLMRLTLEAAQILPGTNSSKIELATALSRHYVIKTLSKFNVSTQVIYLIDTKIYQEVHLGQQFYNALLLIEGDKSSARIAGLYFLPYRVTKIEKDSQPAPRGMVNLSITLARPNPDSTPTLVSSVYKQNKYTPDESLGGMRIVTTVSAEKAQEFLGGE